ncbi:MAG: patatin-like phospholipase family protein [Acidobacteriota bacterium]
MSRGEVRRPRSGWRWVALASLAWPLLSLPAFSAPPDRPKIGLVLSGGGARGCAHAGVIEVLEELRVPVDLIAATSMGAVVGGFYAAGRTPLEIQQGLAVVDWEELFNDQPDYRQLSMRRKADARRFVDLELGWKQGPAFPSGLVGGQNLDLIFQSETLTAVGIEDFDRLPIPFRAMATDLATGLPVALAEGNLPTAMRASMSIPGVFAPLSVDGALLVDGGLTMNLPVSTAREMGAEVTLVIDVSGSLLDESALDSVFGILAQTFGLLGSQATAEQRAQADFLLRPELTGVNPMQYESCPSLFSAGVAAARARADDLATYSLPEGEWRVHLAERFGRRVPRPETVALVSIDGTGPRMLERVRRRVGIESGDSFDLEVVADDIERIFGMGEFERVRVLFDLAPEGLEVIYQVREKSWGPSIFRFSLFAADDLEGNARTDLLVGFTRTAINRRGGEWRLEVEAGETRRFFSEFYQPLDFSGRWFVAPFGEERRGLTDVYSGDRKVAEYAVETSLGGADLGLLLGHSFELRLGGRRGQARARVAVGAVDLPRLSVDVAALEATATLDRLDSPDIPRQGLFARLSAYSSLEDLGADDRYDKITAEIGLFLKRGAHGLFGQLEAGASPGSELPAYDEFTLGGIQSLSGFGEGQLRGQSFAVGRLGYSYRILELPPALGGAVYAGGWLEAGNVSQSQRPREIDNLILTGTLALGIETRLGPLYVAYGAAEGGFDRFYAALGKRF